MLIINGGNVIQIRFLNRKGHSIIQDNELLIVREKLYDILGKLGKDAFLQVHKSFIVGKDHIQRVEGNQIFINNHVIPIGKYFKAGLLSFLN